MKNIPGTITISNPQPDDVVAVTIDDPISGTRVVEFVVNHKEFSQALGHRSRCSGTIKYFNDSGKVGMVREHKSIIVPRLETRSREDIDIEAEARKLWAKWEVDGWQGRAIDGCNSHNHVGKDKVKVCFTRWVSKEVHNASGPDSNDVSSFAD